ncbi:hypothetical protein OsJ_09356 [Oryza sativa Japonica Group]|uniref:RRM domain-containing protein n=3 Tax=Oryza TaxID=4527 RepID=B9FB00_ORYSJ|nr:hypothetical protein OsJ_09356 [Oryza sativa Japonica Group]
MALPTLCKMFVGGIGPYTGDEDLRRHFQLFGYVASVHMPIDRHTGRHHGFAFIQFTCLEHLINALAYRHTIHGHTPPYGDRMDYLRKFGTMDNGVLKIDGVVESISNDGKTCTIRVPNRSGDTPVPSRYCCPSSVFAGSSPERMPTLRIRVAGSDDAALDPRHCCHAAALIGSCGVRRSKPINKRAAAAAA